MGDWRTGEAKRSAVKALLDDPVNRCRSKKWFQVAVRASWVIVDRAIREWQAENGPLQRDAVLGSDGRMRSVPARDSTAPVESSAPSSDDATMIQLPRLNRRYTSPFPWYGGKSRVAPLVWERFGDVRNYVEPFGGSLATLLERPHWPWSGNRLETVNDADCYLANFWRALQSDPDAVAHWASWPVNECDLHARHQWLIDTGSERVQQLRSDPGFYDAKVAGWWVWGLCQWIGAEWCQRPTQTRPHLGYGKGVHRVIDTREYMRQVSERLASVRVCCGDWHRVCGPSPTVRNGTTAVLLDPPYSSKAGRREKLYAADDLDVANDVRRWAIEHGNNPDLRIALCGFSGEHAMPDSWECIGWKSAANRRNGGRERIWFSPHCLPCG